MSNQIISATKNVMICLLAILLSWGTVDCNGVDSIEIDTEGKKISFAVLGNSISTYSGTLPKGYRNYYTSSKLSKNEMWWAQLSQKTGIIMIANSSWSGATVGYRQDLLEADSISFFYSDNRVNSLSRNGIPDIIIVLGGTNDWKNNVRLGNVECLQDVTTFYGAYSLMAEKIRNRYPSAILVFCGILPRIQGADSENKLGWTIRQGNEVIKEISQSSAAVYVDMDYCGIENDFSQYTFDGLHPNAAGMELIANELMNVVNKLLNNNN